LNVNFLTPGHLAVIALVFVLVFGFRRLPDAARSLGQSLRIFKSEVRELNHDTKPDTSTTQAAPAQPVHSERVEPPAADGRSA
jgi:sec-independent protein translocase protein TatA